MTRNISKRRRRENSVQYSSDSTHDSLPGGNDYYVKAKGKRKIRDDADQGEEEENNVVEPSSINQEKVVQVCGICLTEEEVERGKLDCCDHYFCFGCIMEWSKVESRCPTCKQRFVTVVRPPVPGMPRSRPRTFRIPHRNQVYEPSEEEIRLFTDPYLHVVCAECQEAGDERLLLLCDGCDAAAHTYCVGLGRSVPRGDWFCEMCSIQVHGFNSDEQGHDDEYNEEQEAEMNTGTRISMLVADVSRIQQMITPRRVAAPRLNRAGGRHTRLHPAPTMSEEAQALVSSNPEASQSSSISSDVESTPGAARTLSSQRLIRQRVNDFRNNWDQLRRGELQFDSISHSPPRTRASQAAHSQANGRPLSNLSNAVPEVAPTDDISQAWSMMEQARALGGDTVVPNPAPRTRTGGNRDTSRGRVPPSGRVISVLPPRSTQYQEQNVRTESARNGNQMAENRSRVLRELSQEQTMRRANVREVNHLAGSSLRRHRDAAEELSGRREGTFLVETRSRDQRDQSEEREPRGEDVREDVRESNRSVESWSSGGRNSGRRDNDSVRDVQANSMRELRLDRDGSEGNVEGRSVPRSSAVDERRRAPDRNGRRAQPEADRNGRRAQPEADRNGRRAQPEADRNGRRAQPEADRNGRRAQPEADRNGRRAQPEADRNGRRAQPEADRNERRAQPEADRNERRAQPEAEGSGRRALHEDGEADRPLTRRTSMDRSEMKEQVAHYVKAELKPLYRLGHIDKEQHRSIARLATQELLGVFGIERLRPETRGTGSVTSACTHRSSPSTSSLWPNSCTQCVRQNVSKVVGALVRRAVGIVLL